MAISPALTRAVCGKFIVRCPSCGHDYSAGTRQPRHADWITQIAEVQGALEPDRIHKGRGSDPPAFFFGKDEQLNFNIAFWPASQVQCHGRVTWEDRFDGGLFASWWAFPSNRSSILPSTLIFGHQVSTISP